MPAVDHPFDSSSDLPFDPPFDPPFVTTIRTETGVTRFETLIDGTSRPVSRPAVDIASFSALPATLSGMSGVKGAGRHPAQAAAPGGRVFLSVPFAEKDDAKGIGARWDATRKKWYVPQGLDITLFARWREDAA